MSKLAKLVKMSQNEPTYIKWNLTKNGSLLPKITHICGKETKFQNRIDTPGIVPNAPNLHVSQHSFKVRGYE